MIDPLKPPFAEDLGQAIQPWMPALRRLAIRLTGNTHDAEDLVQETVMRVQPHVTEVSHLERPWPWLARVLYRLFVDEWRRQQRQPERQPDADPEAHADAGDSPDEAFERALTRERLQRALDRLPAAQREVLILYDVEGYTLTEVVAITGAPKGTLKSRLHRARSAMRAELIAQ